MQHAWGSNNSVQHNRMTIDVAALEEAATARCKLQLAVGCVCIMQIQLTMT